MRSPESMSAVREVVAQLVELRRERNLSQVQLAQRMGTVQSAVSDIERGDTDMRVSTLFAMAAAVGARLAVSIDASICGRCKNEPPDGFTCNACGRVSFEAVT